MSDETLLLLYIALALFAIVVAFLYLRTRRRRSKKKSAPPVRPATPSNQTAGVARGFVTLGAARRFAGMGRAPVACSDMGFSAGRTSSRRAAACQSGTLV